MIAKERLRNAWRRLSFFKTHLSLQQAAALNSIEHVVFVSEILQSKASHANLLQNTHRGFILGICHRIDRSDIGGAKGG